MFEHILEQVSHTKPLVHTITNYVTVNDVANILLACGGSPIMADDIAEVEQITAISNSVVINIGTLNARTIPSMMKAGKKANELGIPVILDPVGAGASPLRTNTVFNLLDEVKFAVIRGNVSEIKTLCVGNGLTKGVDAAATDIVSAETIDSIIASAQALSQKTGAVIVITGATDLVVHQETAYVIKNGHEMMAKITGTGCMLSAVIGAYCGANPDQLLLSAAAAVCSVGLSGELAYQKTVQTNGGTASFRTYFIDYMSQLNQAMLQEGMNIESR